MDRYLWLFFLIPRRFFNPTFYMSSRVWKELLFFSIFKQGLEFSVIFAAFVVYFSALERDSRPFLIVKRVIRFCISSYLCGLGKYSILSRYVKDFVGLHQEEISTFGQYRWIFEGFYQYQYAYESMLLPHSKVGRRPMSILRNLSTLSYSKVGTREIAKN